VTWLESEMMRARSREESYGTGRYLQGARVIGDPEIVREVALPHKRGYKGEILENQVRGLEVDVPSGKRDIHGLAGFIFKYFGIFFEIAERAKCSHNPPCQ